MHGFHLAHFLLQLFYQAPPEASMVAEAKNSQINRSRGAGNRYLRSDL